MRGGRRGRGRRATVLVAVVCALALTSGCTSTGASRPAAAIAGGSSSSTALPQATVAVAPVSGSVGVAVDQPVTVTAGNGKLTSVTLTDGKGRAVQGAIAADGVTWTSTGPLRLAAHYVVAATAIDTAGQTTQDTSAFITLKPRKVLVTSISPLSGQSVGVGMPIVVRFNAPVTDRATVERALVVTSSVPVEGAWSWTSDTEVHYRPRVYWPAQDKVTLDVNLKNVNAGNGVWGAKSRTISFDTGAAMVSLINVDTHTLTVTRNGQTLRVIPISTGKAGFLTRNGIKVILEKYTLKVMDATTIGIAKGSSEYYRLDVPYAMRVTWSGEFVHAAPWSVRSQGRTNVSHGCVGMSTSNAIWLYNSSTVGDVVKVVGSPRQLEPGNGYTDWNVSWPEWLAGSALQS